ncbi:MAG: hypothetical protein KDB10_23360 [Acidimicrobiales bacterium]|nr:hypothetical protein [Acidimicrobiales bacterium]
MAPTTEEALDRDDVPDVPDGWDADAAPGPERGRDRRWALGLVALLVVLVAVNAVWVANERSGYAMDVDEMAYFDHAVQAAQWTEARNVGGLRLVYFEYGYPEAPLLSVLTVPFLVVGEMTLGWALIVQLAVLVALLVTTFALVRRLVGAPWALLAAAIVGIAPGTVDYTRSYHFALLATATLTASVWFLVASERFTRTWPALAGGACVGLTLLSRTMMVALVAGVVAAALLAVLVPGEPRGPRLARAAGGLGVAAVVAGPWWLLNWGVVSEYLTGYGFGAFGAAYGPLYSPTEPLYYLRVPYRLAVQLALPLALVLLVGLVLVVPAVVARARRRGLVDTVVRGVTTGHTLVVVVLVLGAAALMSSRNNGTGFVLPLVPLVVALALWGVSRIPAPSLRWGFAGVAAAVLLADLVMTSGMGSPLDDPRLVQPSRAEGPIAVTSGESRYERYLAYSDYPPGTDPAPLAAQVVDDVRARSTTDPTVVAVTFGDFLVNVNLLQLEADLSSVDLIVWSTAPVLEPAVDQVAADLEASAGNPPTEFLLSVDPAPAEGTFAGAIAPETLEEAARSLGFTPVETYPVAATRVATLWQRDGPGGA